MRAHKLWEGHIQLSPLGAGLLVCLWLRASWGIGGRSLTSAHGQRKLFVIYVQGERVSYKYDQMID